MKKLVKNIDEETKVCENVFSGTNTEWALSEGYEEKDVEQGYDGNWYLEGFAPLNPPEPTWEEIDAKREMYRETHIDTRTKARVRKMANHTWTDEDEQEYLALDAEVTAYIEEHFPYPVK